MHISSVILSWKIPPGKWQYAHYARLPLPEVARMLLKIANLIKLLRSHDVKKHEFIKPKGKREKKTAWSKHCSFVFLEMRETPKESHKTSASTDKTGE